MNVEKGAAESVGKVAITLIENFRGGVRGSSAQPRRWKATETTTTTTAGRRNRVS